MPLVYSFKEAGHQLAGRSERTIRRMVKRGDLPVIKVSGLVGIPAKALDEWVDLNTETRADSDKCRTDEKIARIGGSRGRGVGNRCIALVAQLTTGKPSA